MNPVVEIVLPAAADAAAVKMIKARIAAMMPVCG